MRIVLVEDNLQLATTIADGLSEDGYTVEVVGTAADGIDRGLRRDMDLMVLDLGLPDRDGLEVLNELRAARINVPILVLTARDAVDARGRRARRRRRRLPGQAIRVRRAGGADRRAGPPRRGAALGTGHRRAAHDAR